MGKMKARGMIEIARLIGTAYTLLDALDRRTLSTASPPLTNAQYRALTALEQAPGQNLGELAGRLLCDKANASGLIDRLAAVGLATRTRDPVDARRVVLDLTKEGRSALASANSLRAAALGSAMARIPSSESERLEVDLSRLIEALCGALEHPGPTEAVERS
jgi:DNA-binding MarR family transcriptional regulator